MISEGRGPKQKLEAPRSRGRRIWVAMGVGMIVVVAVCIAVAVLASSGDGPIKRQPQTAKAHVVLSDPDRRRLEVGLASQDPRRFNAVLVREVRASFADPQTSMLPAGSRLVFVAGTFSERGGIGTVTAVVQGPKPGRFTVLLARENGHWLVVSTEADTR